MSNEITREYTNAKLAFDNMQMRNISGLTPDERFELDKEAWAINNRYNLAMSAYHTMIGSSLRNNHLLTNR